MHKLDLRESGNCRVWWGMPPLPRCYGESDGKNGKIVLKTIAKVLYIAGTYITIGNICFKYMYCSSE